MSGWKESVRRRFDAAAGSYDGHAGPQRRVAADLARRVLAQPLPAGPEVLEIGCGTGALTAALSPAALGRILRAGNGPFTATYDVLTVLWRRAA